MGKAMQSWMLDLRSVRRSMWKLRGSTTAIVGLLGLGVTLSSTMFALADPFVGKPLAYPGESRLVIVSLTRKSSAGLSSMPTSDAIPSVREWRTRSDLVEAVATFRPAPSLMRIVDSSRVIPLQVATATRELLGMVGMIDVPCESSNAVRCLLLTAPTQRHYFGTTARIVGTTLRSANREPLVIAGETPDHFIFPWPSPTHQVQAILVGNDDSTVPVSSSQILVRRRQDVTEERLVTALQATLPNGAWDLKIERLDGYMTKLSAPTAWGALIAGSLILVVCIATIANLLFSRQMHRSGEFLTRQAIGASRMDLFRLIAIDLVGLTVTAMALATILTFVAVQWLRTAEPVQFQILGMPRVSARVMSFLFLTTTGASLIASGLSSLALCTISAGAFANRRSEPGRLLRLSMVALQTMLALLLIVTSILLVRSFANLFGQQTGLSPSTVIVSASFRSDAPNAAIGAIIDDALNKLRHIRGVQSADVIIGPPLIADVRMSGCCVVAGGTAFSIGARAVTAGFFDSIGARVLSGRTLLSDDKNGSGIVVNAALARRAWPLGSAIGQPIQLGIGDSASHGLVVGVVQDIFDSRLDRVPEPAAYRLLDSVRPCPGCEIGMDFMVRPTSANRDIAGLAGNVVASTDTNVALIQANTAGERLTRSVAERVFRTFAVLMFTVVTVLVCVGGLIGVVAFVTARRTRELAIRIAVGASPMHIMRTVSQGTMLAACVGVVSALLVASIASKALQSVVYNVHVSFWAAGLPAAGVMMVVIACSVGLTARRALRLPVSACLRQE